jgi:hypothetical protein
MGAPVSGSGIGYKGIVMENGYGGGKMLSSEE